MLGWAKGRGQARAKASTPREYARQLISTPGFDAPPIKDLTRVYQRARYGEIAADEDALRAARSALARLTKVTDKSVLGP
jgi:hypothetical protein